MENEEIVLALLLGIGVPVILGSILAFIYVRGRHSERMAMIKQGVAPLEPAKSPTRVNRYTALRNGLVMIGIALGLTVGVFLQSISRLNEWFSLVLATLFAGIGFVVYFFLARKMEQLDKDDKSKQID